MPGPPPPPERESKDSAENQIGPGPPGQPKKPAKNKDVPEAPGPPGPPGPPKKSANAKEILEAPGPPKKSGKEVPGAPGPPGPPKKSSKGKAVPGAPGAPGPPKKSSKSKDGAGAPPPPPPPPPPVKQVQKKEEPEPEVEVSSESEDSDEEDGELQDKGKQYHKRVISFFNFMDIKFNSSVSPLTLQETCEKIRFSISPKRLYDVLEQILGEGNDPDTSSIDLPHFVNWFMKRNEVATALISKFVIFLTEKDAAELFEYIVGSQDDVLTVAHLDKAYKSLDMHMSKSKSDRVFRYIGSGMGPEIEFDVFSRWYKDQSLEAKLLGERWKEAVLNNRAAYIFSLFDHRKKGNVDAKVLLDGCRILSMPCNQEKSDKLLVEICHPDNNPCFTLIQFQGWVGKQSAVARNLLANADAYILHKEMENRERELQLIEVENEQKMKRIEEEKNSQWVRRMAMDFSSKTWPKSLPGYRSLGASIKAAMSWEDPSLRQKPEKERKVGQNECRAILLKEVRKFHRVTDRIHDLVESSKYYENEEQEYWNWRTLQASKLIDARLQLCSSADDCKGIIRHGTRCLSEYTMHLERVNKKTKSKAHRNAEVGHQQAVERVKEKLLLERLRLTKEAEKTARDIAEKEANRVPVEYFKQIAKSRLYHVKKREIIARIGDLESKVEPDRVKRVQIDFGDFGKDSNVLSDKNAYCKGLAAELEAQKEAKNMLKRMKVSKTYAQAKERVRSQKKKHAKKLSPVKVFRGSLSKLVDRSIAKTARRSIHTKPRVILKYI